MIGESDAVLLDPLPAGDRDRPSVEEVLLVDQDEEDIVAAGRRVRGGDGARPAPLRRRPAARLAAPSKAAPCVITARREGLRTSSGEFVIALSRWCCGVGS